jgi:hypothetical protein
MSYESYEERGTKICNLEEEIESMRQQLSEHIKREAMLRSALEYTSINGFCSSTACDKMNEAFSATANLDGLILCEKNYSTEMLGVKLYRAWEPK